MHVEWRRKRHFGTEILFRPFIPEPLDTHPDTYVTDGTDAAGVGAAGH